MARKKNKKKTLWTSLPSADSVTDIVMHDRPSLTGPFRKWVRRLEEEEEAEYDRMIEKYGSEEAYYKALYKKFYNGWYDSEYDDDDMPDPYNYKNEGAGYDDYEIEDAEKRIYFYANYDDESTVIEFDSVKEFDGYCTSMGYKVNQADAMDIAYCDEYHCALNPYDLQYRDEFVVIGAETYDDLHFRCQELEYYANLDEENMDCSFSTTW